MKIVTIVGARPQFIKAAAVSRVLKEKPDVEEVLVHTGQHYDDDMSEIFFRELDIAAPKYNLEIGSGSHGRQTGRMLDRIEELLLLEKPDWILVYGDTNSTLAGALAASKIHIPIAHVEAGLRSFNRRMPEEQNRVLTDHMADLLFTPTAAADHNLKREGIPLERIVNVGDVMYDAVLHARAREHIRTNLLAAHGVREGEFVLATIHRAENTDDPKRLVAIFDGLAKVALELPVLLPLHPRTRAALKTHNRLSQAGQTLKLTEPLGYFDMVALEVAAALVATDSGGVQKEAYFAGTPCVTLRGETEWVELVELGWNRVVMPTNAAAVATAILSAMGGEGDRDARPYGSGDAARRIVARLVDSEAQ